MEERLSDEWYPPRCKMMLYYEDEGEALVVKVDPSFPNAWQREPYYSILLRESWKGNITVQVGKRLWVLKDGIAQEQQYDREKALRDGREIYGDVEIVK
jgi:hypothetical protein